MTLYEQTDFLSEDETLAQWRARTCPAPTPWRDRVAIAVIPVGAALSLLAFLYALKLLVIA